MNTFFLLYTAIGAVSFLYLMIAPWVKHKPPIVLFEAMMWTQVVVWLMAAFMAGFMTTYPWTGVQMAAIFTSAAYLPIICLWPSVYRFLCR